MNIDKYTHFFENLSSETPLCEYENVFDKNATFKDPFHEVTGLDKIYNIFQNMYKKLFNPGFEILEVVQNDDVAYIKWNFSFRFKNSSNDESFEGISRVEFDKSGKAISHIDYWDAAENLYEKIPFISSIIKLIKKKINN